MKIIEIKGLNGLDNCVFSRESEVYMYSDGWSDTGKYECNHPDSKDGLCCRDYVTFVGCPLLNNPVVIQVIPEKQDTFTK